MASTSTDEVLVEYSQKWWVSRVQERERELGEKWWDFAQRINDRYLDLRAGTDSQNQNRYNMFWANVQIMKAALYSTVPKASVKRTNSDSKDDVARVAAMMLERILTLDLEKDDSDMHTAIEQTVEDRLISGMGNVWLRYEVETEGTGENEKIVEESAPCDYVHWRDFLWSPARTWGEVWWVGRRCWMKKKAFIKRFGAEKYDVVKATYESAARTGILADLPKGFSKGRVEVLELWCEDTNRVYWVNRHLDDLLDSRPDPLKLDNFFPCPPPLIATHTTSEFMPRADYTMARDQYDELDTLNDRISVLTRALRVVGVFDKNQAELSKILTGSEFNMIPVDNWAMFSEKGGIKGTVDWFPVDVIAKVLGELTIQRQAVIGQIYELTSISDIQRGASNPRETAKAQTLKAQYSSVRLQLTQNAVARWVSHVMQIKAEIIGRHFQPRSIIEQSQIEMTESSAYADAAVSLIKDYERTDYRIKVSEETLSMADYTAEREMRTEYITAVGQFLSQAQGVLEIAPQAMPMLLKMVQWATSSFRGSTDIETVLDEAIKSASAPQEPKPDPKAGENQLKLQIAGMQQQAAQASDQVRLQIAQMNNDAGKAIAEANNATKLMIADMQAKFDAAQEAALNDRETARLHMEQMIERTRLMQDSMHAILQHHSAMVENEKQREHELGMTQTQQEHETSMAETAAEESKE